MDIIPATAPKILTSDNTFSKYLLIFDVYPKIPKNYGMEKITKEEVMDNLDMFQYIFLKIDKFGWLNLEKISEDEGNKFTSTGFKEEYQTRGVSLTLAALEHQ